MDNRSDIWRRLQDHQTPPPPGMFARLCARIRELQKNESQVDLTGSKDKTDRLERLQQHETQPPSHLRASIQKSIVLAAQGRPGATLPFFKRKFLFYELII